MRRVLAFAAWLILCGCYEIPPSIPPGYIGSQAAPGWPPLAVYHPEPLHPRNRWFHRVFSSRGAAGEIQPAHADEPFGLTRKPSAVDTAEWLALLRPSEGGAGAEEIGSPRDSVTDAIYRSDLLAEASRLLAECPGDDRVRAVAEAFLQRSREGRNTSMLAGTDCPPAALPPPLRHGKWTDAPPSTMPGLAPSAFDPRWTRLLREQDGSRHFVLLRLRVASDRGGAAVLLGIASECWELERGEDGESRRVWRFDRAEWLQGREPWRLVPDDAEITIRSPADPAVILAGSAERLCASCHCETHHELSSVALERRQESPSQETAVTAALARLLER